MGENLKKLKGFTLAELIIGIGVSLLIFGLIVTSIQWLRYSMTLISSVDNEAQLLRLPRLLNRELQNAREVVVPEENGVFENSKPMRHLVFKDSSGSISIVFLDTHDRLVQFNYARSQFRDLISGVKSFKVWHSFKNKWEYQIVIKSKKGEESIFGALQIQKNNI